MKFKVDKSLFPFENKFFTTSDKSLVHYVDEGEGTPILMLHGNPTWSFLYRKMIKNLSGEFRCIAPDYPGFGLSVESRGYNFLPDSHINAISELVEYLELKDIVIVMQDWGGPIGLKIAQENPDIISGFVIGNTWGWPLKGNKRIELFSAIMGGLIGRLGAYLFNGVLRFFIKKGFIVKPNNDELKMYEAPFKERASRMPTALFPAQLIQALSLENEIIENIESIREKPTLLLWATQDFAFRKSMLDKFKDIFINHKHVSLYSGHFWQDESGEEASIHLTNWLKTVKREKHKY